MGTRRHLIWSGEGRGVDVEVANELRLIAGGQRFGGGMLFRIRVRFAVYLVI